MHAHWTVSHVILHLSSHRCKCLDMKSLHESGHWMLARPRCFTKGEQCMHAHILMSVCSSTRFLGHLTVSFGFSTFPWPAHMSHRSFTEKNGTVFLRKGPVRHVSRPRKCVKTESHCEPASEMWKSAHLSHWSNRRG